LDSKAALEADPTLEIPPESTAAPNAGDLAKLFPQLEILGQLGAGGMGAVYKARQKQLDRLVALKLMHPRFSRDPQFAERFNREARALAKLSHPNIVHVYEFGTVGVAGTEQFYFIMEYVDGANLQQLIATKSLSAEQALTIVPKLCDALQYAHDEGVVHRDIKPANILVDKKGRVKIADFGLAKIAGVEDGRLTRTNQGMGTMMYMAPEQMENAKSVDHRADIYSLGVVFYEMLTGELPMGHFAPPSEKVQVDVRFDEIVLHALERDVERRYQHVSEVKTAVENVTSTLGAAANPALPATVLSRPKTEPRLSRIALMGAIWAAFFFVVAFAALAVVAVIGPALFRADAERPEHAGTQLASSLATLLPGMFARCETAVAAPRTTLPVGAFVAPSLGGIVCGIPFFILLFIVALAPFGTTLMGAVAIKQIKNSNGKLYGMRLAIFDALLFPLLVLDALLMTLISALVMAVLLVSLRVQTRAS
jgi:tRNA A-37 threonylcarbamoyl transferase component Bud32